MKQQKRKLACMLIVVLCAVLLGACRGDTGNDDNAQGTPAPTAGGQEDTGGDSQIGGNTPDQGTGGQTAEDGFGKTLDALELGAYTDLKADIRILSHRTDLKEDGTFDAYIAEFQKLYPNVKITYDAVTDYESTALIRLTQKNWGTICMVPNIEKVEFQNYFEPLGALSVLEQEYGFINEKSFGGTVYGVSSMGNAQGVLYNRRIFEEAGITALPKTPDEFLDALEQIADETDAIPLYTNFGAGWTMGAWDAYIGGSATGDADFMNIQLPHMKNPFARRDDMTGPYAVYYVLYEAVARDLIEEDPTTTDWEGSKVMLNNGDIATMVLGSWAVTQVQAAGDHAEDVGYMPFPITVDGKQYATAGGDYHYAVNKNASEEEKLAAKLYILWLTEESNFAFDQGGIPIRLGEEYPDVMRDFADVTLVADSVAREGEEDLLNNVNSRSEVGINTDNAPDQAILEAALSGSQSLDEIMADWNARWSSAQEALEVEVWE